MDSNKFSVIEKRIKKVCNALALNNMAAYYAPTKADAKAIVTDLLKEGMTIASGGSVTLAECGIMDELRSGKYNYLDRTAVAPEKIPELYRAAFSADAYLCSANAITESGELFNVDGNSNRVAAICYGPESVIVVAGYNKIVADIKEASDRVKKISAPANTARLGAETYCLESGECLGCKSGGMTDGCRSQSRICCSYVISAYQRVKGRIKVIIVGEELGY